MLDVISYVNIKKDEMKRAVEFLTKAGHRPRMAIITDDKNFDANASYIKSKTHFALDVGVACDVIVMKEDDEFPDLEPYHGAIVQYPFRGYDFDAFRFWLSDKIPPEKDIDGLTYQSHFKPCTPLGIVNYLEHLRDEKIIEGNVAVHTAAAQEQVDAAVGSDLVLVALALSFQILSHAVENVDVLSGDVDVVEEIVVHEVPVALVMLPGQAHILVHVEGHHILEAHFTGLVHLNQALIDTQGGGAGGQTKNKGAVFLMGVDGIGNVLRGPGAHILVIIFDDQFHAQSHSKLE
mgnify:CR=1 FL=1